MNILRQCRIKNYHNENPDSELILELNYDAKNSKNAQVMKNVKKLFPDAKVIDNPEIEIDEIWNEIENRQEERKRGNSLSCG